MSRYIAKALHNDFLTQNKQKKRQDKLIYTYKNTKYIHNIHIKSIYKNAQTCPNR